MEMEGIEFLFSFERLKDHFEKRQKNLLKGKC